MKVEGRRTKDMGRSHRAGEARKLAKPKMQQAAG